MHLVHCATEACAMRSAADLAVGEVQHWPRLQAPVGESAVFDAVVEHHRVASSALQRDRRGRNVKVLVHVTAGW